MKIKIKDIDIKSCMCYHFDDIIKGIDICCWYFIKREKIYENISAYDISYKTSTGPKLLRIKFYKIDGFIRVRSSEFKHWIMDW